MQKFDVDKNTRNWKLDVRPIDVAYVLGRYTEIPNRYLIFWNTDTDTDVGIHNTEKYRISTIKYRKYRKSVRYSPPVEQLSAC